jgi:hypothetical protein
VTSVAFGIELTGEIDLPGTEAGRPAGGASLRFRQATRAELAADWTAPTEHVARQRAGGRTVARVVRNAGGDLLFRARGIGLFDLREGVTLARYAPVARPSVPWGRYVVAQVLPFAALLRGLEVLHAGAVAVGNEAVAVAAPSTGGKSTLLAALVQRGAPLVADDVVAVQTRPGGLIAYPGPALLSLRDGAAELLGGPGALEALGPRAEDVPGGSWRAVPRHAEALPLRALVILERSPRYARVELARIDRPDPRALIGATFNAAWQEPGRMTRLLDVCATLANDVALFTLRAPLDAPPGRLAAAVASEVG